jgi:hypothetical protein
MDHRRKIPKKDATDLKNTKKEMTPKKSKCTNKKTSNSPPEKMLTNEVIILPTMLTARLGLVMKVSVLP